MCRMVLLIIRVVMSKMKTIQFFSFLFTCLVGLAGLTYAETLYNTSKKYKELSVRYLIIFSIIVNLFCFFLFVEYSCFHRSALGTGWTPAEKSTEIALHMAILFSWLLYVREVTNKNSGLLKKISNIWMYIYTIVLIILNAFFLDNHYHTNSKLIPIIDATSIMLAIVTMSIFIIIYATRTALCSIPKSIKYFIIIESILIIINFAWNNLYTIQLVYRRYIFGDFYNFGDLDFTAPLLLAIICLSILAIRNSVISCLKRHIDTEPAKQIEVNRIRIAYALTPRETEVLELLIKDVSYYEICSELNVTINTVKKHVTNLYRKVDVTSKSELFRKFHP